VVEITVRHRGGETTLDVDRATVLRDALLAAGLSPYAGLGTAVNCGGRGFCATCGVRLLEGPPPEHWHDRLAARFGYPRLSCQVTVEDPVTVRLVEDRRLWGGREREPPGRE